MLAWFAFGAPLFAQTESSPPAADDDLTALSLEDLLDLEYDLPIGVLGAHTHHEGEFMLGLTRSYMKMGGSVDGTSNVSTTELFKTYPTVHSQMIVRKTVLTAMYAPSDETTLMAMVPQIRKEARHEKFGGGRFTEVSDGIGDVQIHALRSVYREGDHRMHFNAGLSLPTGSIDVGPGSDREHYMQQLGSGTVDLRPGLTYLGETEDLGWGAQLNTVLRLGKNKHDYRLGNRYALTAWVMPRITDNVALSFRLNAQHWGNIRGADKALDITVISENNADHYGGERVDALIGLNFYGTDGAVEGQRLEIEAGWPVWQELDGPQLETDFVGTVSWKVVF